MVIELLILLGGLYLLQPESTISAECSIYEQAPDKKKPDDKPG